MQRVMWYGRKHYLENARGYLYGALALCGLQALVIMLYGVQIASLQTMLMGAAAVYCVQLTCRSHYDKLQSGYSYTLPVTQTEKFLFMWFNTVVVSSAVILLLGFVFSWCALLFSGDYTGLKVGEDYVILWLVFFGMQSGALFVCCWIKGSPLKGYLIILGIFLAFLFVHYWFWRRFFDFVYDIPLSQVSAWVAFDGAVVRYSVGKLMSSSAAFAFQGLWIPVLWVAAYFKFRERTLK